MKLACFLIIFALPLTAAEVWLQAVTPDSFVRLINPASKEQVIILSLIQSDGSTLVTTPITLKAKQALMVQPSQWASFMGSVDIRVVSLYSVLLQSVRDDGRNLSEREGQPLRAGSLPIPHIAEAAAFWDTRLFLSTSDGLANLDLIVGGKSQTLVQMQLHQSHFANLETLLGNPVLAGSGWGQVHSRGPLMAGSLEFGTSDGTQLACLPLNMERSCQLTLPHIPVDSVNWWTGLVLINSHDQALAVQVEIHSDVGLIGQSQLEIPPASKYVDLMENVLGGSVPAGASWLRLKAERSLVGFELFGTRNRQALAGLPLTNQAHKRLVMGWLGDMEQWSGAVFLNPGFQSAQVTLNAFADGGTLARTVTFSVPAGAKKTLLLQDVLKLKGAYWVEAISDSGLQAFQLLGDKAFQKLAAFQPVDLDSGDLDVGLPKTMLDSPANLFNRKIAFADYDGDGVKEIISEDGSQLLLADLSGSFESFSIPFADFDFSVPMGSLVYPQSFDLDQDGTPELVLNTTHMSIYRLGSHGEISLFQPFKPDVAADPVVRGAEDFNGDGWLDLVTNRAFFRSFPTLTDPYNLNSFPSQFPQGGKGTLILNVNGDFYPDLVSALFDSMYAIVTNNAQSFTSPLYVPKAPKDILQMFRFDFDEDGYPEIFSFLAATGNSVNPDLLDIAHVASVGSRSLFQIPVQQEWGLSNLKLVGPESGPFATIRQHYGGITRTWRLSPDGINPQTSLAGVGELEDVNGDGLRDLVSASGTVFQEPGEWFPNPAAAMVLDPLTAANVWHHLEDYDGDQEWELMEVRLIPGQLATRVRLLEPAEQWSQWSVRFDFEVEIGTFGYATFMDWDQDGDLDLLVAGVGLKLHRNTNGQFNRTGEFITPPNVYAITSALSADFDQNGNPDLLGYKPGSGNKFYLVYDYLTSTPKTRFIDVNGSLAYVEILDFNRDGLPDFTLQDPSRNKNIFINRGIGDFILKPVEWSISDFTQFDVDGDGEYDLVGLVPIPDNKRQYLRIARNRGDETFSGFFVFLLPEDTFYNRLTGMDVNRDGRVDLVAIGPSSTNQIEWLDIWLNDYEPGFPQIPLKRVMRLPIPSATGLSTLDLNQDGFPDLQILEEFNRLWFLSHVSLHRVSWVNTHPFP
ncbi:MAG: VCBS repeat-containing protein [Acidobacteria bacterium]|nr:VCBS repeat-containing protein [Acidobacteriota bacterium]